MALMDVLHLRLVHSTSPDDRVKVHLIQCTSYTRAGANLDIIFQLGIVMRDVTLCHRTIDALRACCITEFSSSGTQPTCGQTVRILLF